tara:strand:+ start:158 stop:580 length:423 start_codon:yes stop_codon:yes gene_type:complete
MNSVFFILIGIPIIEIYLFIKIGSYIGAFTTISLIFLTAFIGVIYARYEGFNTFRSGMTQLVQNKIPIYEIISGAALTFASLLLIIPGFATDILGLLIIFPPSRKILFKNLSSKLEKKNDMNNNSKNDFIDGEFEDKDEK